ncbi:MAG: hypothetical protein ACXWRU_18565, partial [Pseudobdellovibrionaceae bacterium]
MKKGESIFSELENLQLKVSDLEIKSARDDEKLKSYEQQINWLTEQLNSLKRGQFGSKSERWE